MTIYAQADANVRKTWWLFIFFSIFVIAIGWLFSYLLDSYAILILAVILAISQNFISYWYSDKIVLKMAKAIPTDKQNYPELYRIVENLCITAGLPVPRIYLINEDQPNAFTTGKDAEHAIVAVTSGLLRKLDRAELEGVIAHELSHIKNKDMLLGTVVVTLVGVVALLSNLFLRISFFGGGRQRNNRDSVGLIMLVLGLVAIILAPLAASLIHLAISRKREFLADSSGTLLTRYPEGLARALSKISADSTPLTTANNSTAHLYISSPFKNKQSRSWLTKLFMTHPSIEERIKALRMME